MAITDGQLQAAEDMLGQISDKAAALQTYARQALDGIIQGVELTDSQKQQLKDKYLDEKAQLRQLYEQLP